MRSHRIAGDGRDGREQTYYLARIANPPSNLEQGWLLRPPWAASVASAFSVNEWQSPVRDRCVQQPSASKRQEDLTTVRELKTIQSSRLARPKREGCRAERVKNKRMEDENSNEAREESKLQPGLRGRLLRVGIKALEERTYLLQMHKCKARVAGHG